MLCPRSSSTSRAGNRVAETRSAPVTEGHRNDDGALEKLGGKPLPASIGVLVPPFLCCSQVSAINLRVI